MTDHRRIVRRLFAYLRPYRTRLIVGLVCAGLAGAVPAGMVRMIKDFANRASHGDTTGVLWVSLSVIGIYTLMVGLRYGQGTLLAEVAQRVGLDLRRDVYAHLQRMSLGYFHTRRTGALMATLTNDVGRLQNAAMMVKDGIALPITVAAMVATLVGTSPRLVVFTLAVVPLIAAIIQRITRRLRALSTESQARQAEVSAVMDETLSAPRIVKAFVAEDREVARFQRANEAAVHAQMRGIRRSALLAPLVDWVGALALAAVLYFGATEIKAHTDAMPELLRQAHLKGLTNMAAQEWADSRPPGISLGAFMAFVFAANELARALGGLGNLRGGWQELLGAADRVFHEVLDVAPTVVDAPDATVLAPVKGRIAFEKVSFAYIPERLVLEDIDLTVEPGQVIALVGKTGAGKSTLADLVPRFYDPTSGRVLIDGIDVRTVTQSSLRRQMALVPQRTILFAGSIRDNIAYGRPDADDAAIRAAACAANAHDFIEQTPAGYRTQVGERGTTLSGGQAQRIAIARALLADPRILILDEATSALDSETEALIQEALQTLMRGRTTLIIAHRLSTIVHADKIVVMEKGQIKESGTHAELLAAGGLYAGFFEIQQRADALGATVDGALDDEELSP